MEILPSLEVECVDLRIAAQETAGDKRRENDALATARQQGIITRIEHNTVIDLALGKRSFLRLNEFRCGRGDVKNINVLQRVPERGVHVGVKRLAHLDRKTIIALIVLGAQIIRFVVKEITRKRQASVEKIRFAQRQDEILS